MKAVFTQAVVGALDDIVQHTGRAGGGGERRGEARLSRRLRKQLPQSTQPPPSHRLLCHCVCMDLWKNVCTWRTLLLLIFFTFLLSLLHVPSGRYVTVLRRFFLLSIYLFFIFKCRFYTCRFLHIQISKLTLSEIGSCMKFNLL